MLSDWHIKTLALGIGFPLLFSGQAYSQPLSQGNQHNGRQSEAGQSNPSYLLKQAQQFETWGQAHKVVELAKKAIAILQSEGESELIAIAWGQLGNGYLLKGNFEQAEAAYQRSLTIAQDLEALRLQNSAANGLAIAQRQRSQFYQRQAELMTDDENRQEAAQQAQQAQQNAVEYTNQALFARNQGLELIGGIQTKSLAEIQTQLQAIELGMSSQLQVEGVLNDIENLPPSTNKVFLLIRLSQLSPSYEKEILLTALSEAQSLQDQRTEAFAWLYLGQYHESNQESSMAIEAAQRSQWLAQQEFADDILYQAQWLEARANQKLGFGLKAIKNYQDSTEALERVRSHLQGANQELQLDFREQVEPVYRQYLELLLQRNDRPSLETALEVVDSLKLAQLEDFFGSPCTEITEEIEPAKILAEANAALITSVILPEQTYLILQAPDGGLKRYVVEVSASELTEMIEDWSQQISNLYNWEYHDVGKELYRLLLEPLEADLNSISTLVFNNDGVLRNAPLAALYDGNEYLVQKYPIASTLGLKLEPTTRASKASTKPLIFGLSVPTQTFSQPLPNVEVEIEQIHALLGGKQLLNDQFSVENTDAALEGNKDYSLIHFATHGKFGGTVQTSYLESYDQPINLNQLETLLGQSQIPLSLLVFSACDTATGNERAVLGMAGVGLRAGVKSTLGSLWTIPDAPLLTVTLITDFYTYWHQGMTKAEALQQAQINQIKKGTSHASAWAGMVLLGDWE